MISSISSHEIIKAVILDLKVFLWIATSGDAAITPKGIKKILANSVSKFLIDRKPAVINDRRKFSFLPKIFYFAS